MSSARVEPLNPPYDPATQAAFDKVMPPGVPPLKLFRSMAHNPRVLQRLIAGGSSVSIRLREERESSLRAGAGSRARRGRGERGGRRRTHGQASRSTGGRSPRRAVASVARSRPPRRGCPRLRLACRFRSSYSVGPVRRRRRFAGFRWQCGRIRSTPERL